MTVKSSTIMLRAKVTIDPPMSNVENTVRGCRNEERNLNGCSFGCECDGVSSELAPLPPVNGCRQR